ncbi:Hypothetical protein FKW44_009641, partial [Caligus rogercresseyi]
MLFRVSNEDSLCFGDPTDLCRRINKVYPDGAQGSLKFLRRLIRQYKSYQRFSNV